MKAFKLKNKFFPFCVGIFSIMIVVVWAGSIIKRYDATAYLLASVLATFIILWGLEYKKRSILNVCIRGALVGYFVSLLSNFILEYLFVDLFIEKFMNGAETFSNALFVAILGFPLVLGGWFLGACLSYWLWFLKEK
jgi:hypothetical protein